MIHFEYLDNGGLPIAMAHRGGLAEAERAGLIGNSLEAFSYAVSLGFNYLETDVRATTGGELYIWHGEGVERINKRQPLKKADIEAVRVNGECAVPLLSDVLEALPDTRFAIDPKHWPAVEPLAKVVVDMKALQRVGIGAFSQKRTDSVAHAIYERSKTRVCTVMGPRHLSRFVLRTADPLQRQWQAPDPVLQMPRTLSTPRVIATAHRGDAKVITWAVNDGAEMTVYLDAGVDGIITDEPSLLKSVLQARHQWR